MKLFKPLAQWSIEDVALVGWFAIACIALALRVVPGLGLGIVVGAWCVIGLAKIGPKIVHRDLPLLKLVGVATAWPLALRTDALNQ